MPLSLYYQNIRGGNTKTRGIRNNLSICNYALIFLVETWIQWGVHDSEMVLVEKFQTFRKDRDLSCSGKKTGGGLLVAARKGLNVARRADLESQNIEVIWLVVHSTYTIYICFAYMPDRNSFTDYFKLIKNIQDAQFHLRMMLDSLFLVTSIYLVSNRL